MSTLYLIRHGQAGSRANYDVLSPLGCEQARLLGRHFVAQGIRFDVAFTGALQRQQQSAQLVREQFSAASQTFPSLHCDARWNEFSMAALYQRLAPRLSCDVAAFARDYAAMQQLLAADPHATRGAAGRCDRAVVTAWMSNRYADYDGESWQAMRARVQGLLPEFIALDEHATSVVFSSATPIALLVGAVLQLADEKVLGLMAMLQNTGITTLRMRQGEAWLFNFNATPHLADDSLRTFR